MPQTRRPNRLETNPSSRIISPWSALWLAVGLVGLYYFIPQLDELNGTLSLLGHANWWWAAGALALTFLSFIAGAFTQYAAGGRLGSRRTVFRLQLAGSFVSHFLPFSLGSIGLTVWYYRGFGLSRARGLVVALLPTVFGVLTTIGLLLSVSPVTLTRLTARLHLETANWWLITAVIIMLLAGVIIAFMYQPPFRTTARQLLAGVKAIRGRRQLWSLIFGSLAMTVISAAALLASVESIRTSVAFADVFVVYVLSTLAGGIAPTPGGVGATEAVLTFGLVATGLSLPQAAAATLMYRLITFWLPIIPGGVALRLLRRQAKNV